MKKYLVAFLSSVLLFASCQKDDIEMTVNDEQPSGEYKPMSFSVSIGENSKSALYNRFKQGFQSDDEIAVYDGTSWSPFSVDISNSTKYFKDRNGNDIYSVTTFVGSATESGNYIAVYPSRPNDPDFQGEVDEYVYQQGRIQNVYVPVVQKAVPESYDPTAAIFCAKSTNNTLQFRNCCAMFRIVVADGVTCNSVTFTSNTQDVGIAGRTAINVESAVLAHGSEMSITLKASDGSLQPANYYVPFIPYSQPLSITVSAYNGESQVGANYQITGKVLQRGKIYTLYLTPNGFLPAVGMLTGEFSVSVSKKVHFSQGNLQYNTSNQQWRFADNQWEYVAKPAYGTTGWADLFCWGTGDRPTYWDENETSFSTFMDWGTYCGMGDGWHTLTEEEYLYLIKREGKSGFATIHGINGFVLLPDQFILPDGLSFASAVYKFAPFDTPSTCTINEYTNEEWDKMEAAGAVFFPATGLWSKEDGVFCVQEQGYYYFSVAVSSEDPNYAFIFTSPDPERNYNYHYSTGNNTKSKGHAVRLVW